MDFKDLFFSNIYRNSPAFGLDISDFSIKIAQLEKRRRGFGLKSFNRYPLPEGIIVEGEIRDRDGLIEILKKTIIEAKEGKIKTRYAICSLPEQHAFVKVISFPKMNANELREAVKWEAEANIPFSLDEVYLGWQVISLQPDSENINVLINAVPKKLLNDYLETLMLGGIEPVVFEVESVATARSLVKGGFSPHPVLIIDLGFNRTSFILFLGNSVVFTNSTPIVSNKGMLEDIAEKLNIDFKKAQSLKFKVGLDKDEEEKKIFNALLPSLTKLIEKTKECMLFYKEHGEKEWGCKEDSCEIILCGGGANLSGLSEYLSLRLKISVKPGNPWINILPAKKGKVDLKKMPSMLYDESLAYSTVLGLALRGIEKK